MSNRRAVRRSSASGQPVVTREALAAAVARHLPPVAPPSAVAAPSPPAVAEAEEPVPTAGALERYVERIAPEVVPVSCWFDLPEDASGTVTVRVTGRRIDSGGRALPGDEFDSDETLVGLVPGCGPVALTAKIRDVNPGRWKVTARVQPAQEAGTAGPAGRRRAPSPTYRAGWSWRRWALTTLPEDPVQSCPMPYVRTPGVLRGSWAGLVGLGIVLALVVQVLLVSAQQLRAGAALFMSVVALLVGTIGGKAWFLVLHRRQRRWDGWAVQGFVAATVLTAPLVLAGLGVPIGPYLDTAAPALMVGLAVGRLGCFLTGCCVGRPTGSRWGIWSSNRRVGARRIPTQLMESSIAATVGTAAVVALTLQGTAGGRLFIAVVAAFTLMRQATLRLREEPRRSQYGLRSVAAVSAVVLVADLLAWPH